MCAKGKRKKVKRIPGDILRIDIGDGAYCFGRVLETAVAFYDIKSRTTLKAEEIISRPIIFTIWVMDYAITKGDWPVIGHAPLEESLKVEPLFYKKDSISKRLVIYRDSTGEEIPATPEECEKLECAAAWDPEHVVDRLRDHFAGRPNKWVESLRP